MYQFEGLHPFLLLFDYYLPSSHFFFRSLEQPGEHLRFHNFKGFSYVLFLVFLLIVVLLLGGAVG